MTVTPQNAQPRKVGFTPTESDILNVFPVGKPISVRDLQELLKNRNYYVIYHALKNLEDRNFIQYLETKNKTKYYIMKYTPGKLEVIGRDNTRYPLMTIIQNFRDSFNTLQAPHTLNSSLLIKIPFNVARLFYWANQNNIDDITIKEKWTEVREDLINTATRLKETVELLEGIILQSGAQNDLEQFKLLFNLSEEESSQVNEVIQWYKDNSKYPSKDTND